MALSKLAAAFFLAMACIAQALPAWAGEFTVKPIHVFVNGGARSLVMTVENDADTPLRLQITGFQWGQTPNGDMKLDQTDDLVFFPTLVTVPAKSSQIIRVAVDAQPSSVEQSYRLFFEELPSLDSQIFPERGEHLSFRTKLGIPVFFAPTQSVQRTSIAASWGAPHRLDIAVKNDGSVHTMLYNVAFSAKSASGQTLFTKKLDGWYVLAKGERDFQVALTKAVCARTASIHLTATLENARTISQDITEPCAH
jgi:fimbrial chaperone protein